MSSISGDNIDFEKWGFDFVEPCIPQNYPAETDNAFVKECLKAGENHLTVAVSNAACDTVYPQNADFTFYGGIYRAVRLIVLPIVHFDMDTLGGCGIRVTPKVKAAS